MKLMILICEGPMLADIQQHLMAFRGDRGTFLEIHFARIIHAATEASDCLETT